MNFGFTANPYWIKFTIINKLKTPAKWILEIDYPMIDQIDLYIPDKKGKFIRKKGGDFLPFSEREIFDNNYIFPIETPPGIQTCYLRIQTTSSMNFSLLMWSPVSYLKKLHTSLPAYWMFYGILFAMILYNLLLYFSVRERSYIYYSVFLTTWLLFQLTLHGFAYQHLWPNSIWWTNNSLPLIINISLFTLCLFLVEYHDVKKDFPGTYKFIKLFFLLPCIISFIISLFVEYAVSIRIITFLSLVIPLGSYSTGIYLAVKGSRPARYTLAAFSLCLIGVALYALKTMGFIQESFLTQWGIQLGGTAVVILLSLGLADKINSMKIMLQDLNINLEARVIHRTDELQSAMEELETMNETLVEVNEELEGTQCKMKKDLAIAVNLQHNFLPDLPPDSNDWDIALTYKPMSGVSGDFYDFYFKESILNGLSIFDVSGHGIASGLLAVLAKSICSRIYYKNTSAKLNYIIEEFNRELISEISDVDHYITGIMLKCHGNRIEYVNAGHTELIIKKSSSNKAFTVKSRNNDFKGGFLGIPMMQDNFKTLAFEINKGDTLLLYTDCMIESSNEFDEEYGTERIIKTLNRIPSEHSAQEHLEILMNDFERHIDRKKLSDDLTVILLKKK